MLRFLALLLTLPVLAVSVTVVAVGLLSIMLGFKSAVVVSGSMAPAIRTGDMVIIKDSYPIRIGDVVNFENSEGTFTLHRVTEIREVENGYAHFQTKGDANRVADVELVESKAIQGKVTLAIPKVGYLFWFTDSLPGKVIVIVALAAAVLLIWRTN